jgi:acyl dehydratase
MQHVQNIREITDGELRFVCGGSSSPTDNTTHTDTQVSVRASATGGHFHLDEAVAETKSIGITAQGESVSSTVGFALALAL